MKIPLARYGLKEIVLFGGGSLVALALIAWLGGWWWSAAFIPAGALLFTLWFFRDPERRIPDEPGAVVSPADGRILAIEELPAEEFVGGRVLRIDVFLAVTNVHVNRAPIAGEVRHVAAREGNFKNAMVLAHAAENKAMSVGFVARDGGFPFLVRQVVGAVARRIVCPVQIGETYERGERYGMIKFGSRTQLVLPADRPFTPRVKVGDPVRGGATVLGILGRPGEEAGR